MVDIWNVETLLSFEVFFFNLRRVVQVRLQDVCFPDAEDFCRKYSKMFHFVEVQIKE